MKTPPEPTRHPSLFKLSDRFAFPALALQGSAPAQQEVDENEPALKMMGGMHQEHHDIRLSGTACWQC